VRELSVSSWDISGLLRPDEVAEATDVYLPEHEEVETIAGLVAHELERIPEVGDTVTVGGVDREGDDVTITFTVLRMDRHRVDRLRLDVATGRYEERT
jgi:CBS domain containing-hemolysin-like protein